MLKIDKSREITAKHLIFTMIKSLGDTNDFQFHLTDNSKS